MPLFLVGATLLIGASACSKPQSVVRDSANGSTVQPAGRTADSPKPQPLTAEEKALYRDVARMSWAYLDENFDKGTGLVSATPEWAYTTAWDIGSQILGYYAAKELGLLPVDEFNRRMKKTLETLAKAELYNGVAFNKLYSTKDGKAQHNRPGWSATDLGRLLMALKIIAVREPQYAELAERVARRNSFSVMTKNGYIYGQLVGESGKPWTYQEGRIGYEQYVAAGFNAWGAPVENALKIAPNAEPVDVFGVPLVKDKRYNDRLLSEPFILMGIEAGLSGEMKDLAANMLKVQEARFKQTGQVTIVSEDAVAVPPNYFYYYCVYCNGKAFIIDISQPGKELNSPRWVSTKAAFGWHALMPSDYTKTAIDYVAPAKDAKRGWASGVYEGSRKSTLSFDVNTASVLMEIALYQLRGRVPLLQAAAVAGN